MHDKTTNSNEKKVVTTQNSKEDMPLPLNTSNTYFYESQCFSMNYWGEGPNWHYFILTDGV